MSFVAVLLTPFALLFPAAGTVVVSEGHAVPAAALGENPPEWPGPPRRPGEVSRDWVFREVVESFRVESQNQVRIEQNMSVRIAPLSRPMTQPPPQLMFDIPRRELAPRMIERNIGRCLPVASISGVQADSGSRLILYLRDRRMISATLDRACRARDFYSGFYLQRSSDGQICADRDTLLSRSGANCKLTRIRQLIQSED